MLRESAAEFLFERRIESGLAKLVDPLARQVLSPGTKSFQLGGLPGVSAVPVVQRDGKGGDRGEHAGDAGDQGDFHGWPWSRFRKPCVLRRSPVASGTDCND